ncbi:glycosyltransferase [Phaeobacter marinintestinus]|uniref:glycosyltransferase n=1 Tax=Falsiphaeobacter marinintestinus TaxID=1492905 RepID=UPI0011B820FC|nr:glycosyltransferase [Phaeobacter marinintestinus]
MPDPGSLLIYAPVPLHQRDGVLYVERQAANGLRLWAANFTHVTVMMPLSPAPPPTGWIPVTDCADWFERVTIDPLPMAYRPDQFLRAFSATRAHIRDRIDTAEYLSFAIGGLFGDWGSVSALLAHRMGRPFAVWTDRVESRVVQQSIATATGRAKLRARLTHRPMAMLERAVIRKASLGLFHGKETFDTYAPFCANPQIVHDIHIAPEDHIQPDAMDAKVTDALTAPLRIFYAGRADPMKGPLDWVEVLAGLRDRGVAFTATWLGEGSEMAQMRDRIEALDLSGHIALPGFLDRRAAVLEAYRSAQIFLFCHKTPESPRCLIEALASGTVLAGYDGAYARDLIADNGGGVLVPIDDVAQLIDKVAGLDQDRGLLADLIKRAVADGKPYNDVEVFHHRSELIKAYL